MGAALTSNQKYVEPMIISIADSCHYLVGALDSENNFIGLHKPEQIITLHSLGAAKQYLRSNNISSATLEFQSPYDEMCGASMSGQCRQIINL